MEIYRSGGSWGFVTEQVEWFGTPARAAAAVMLNCPAEGSAVRVGGWGERG